MTKLPKITKHRRMIAQQLDDKITETPDGLHKEWLQNGQRHRKDGPAVEWADGGKEWWRGGVRQRDE